MSHETGILISFEGSEGCGKSTQIRRLADRLEEIDHRDVVVTREPGGTIIGEDIRHLLMHADSSKSIFPETELLLFAASRAQLVREIIYPSVQDGKIVLCDRFSDSQHRWVLALKGYTLEPHFTPCISTPSRGTASQYFFCN